MRKHRKTSTIELLEPRRMLATFNATNGPDTIEIRRGTDGITHVTINGGATQDTSDLQVVINALGGNDSVYFPELRNFISEKRLQLFLGDGNDLASNFDPVTQTASLDALDYSHELFVEINAGAGSDTLELDGSDSTDGRDFTFEHSLGPAQAIVRLGDPGNQGFLYNDQLETCVIEGTPSGDHFRLEDKLDSLQPIVSGFEGTDSFFVGDGNMEFGGWFNSNITVSGGAGSDFITLDNHSDGQLATEPYTFDVFKLTKGAGEFSYNSFESQTFRAPNVNTGTNTINVTAFSGQMQSTTIVGGAVRSCTVNLTTGNLVSLSGAVSLNLPGPIDRVNINDQNATGVIDYTFDANRFERLPSGRVINFAGAESMTLNAGASSSNFAVRGTPAGMFLAVQAGAGSDILLLGNGDIDTDLLGQVVMSGGPSSDLDEAIIVNDTDTDLTPQTLVATSFTDGGTHSFISVDSIRIMLGPAGSNVNVNSTAVPTTINGGIGNDTFTVGGGDIDSNFVSGVPFGLVVDGNGGADSVVLNDLNDPNLNAYFMHPGKLDLSDAGVHWFVNWSDVEAVTLEASNGTSASPGTASAIVVVDTAVPLRINGNGGNDFVIVNDATAPVVVHTGLGDRDLIDVNQDFDAGPTIATIDQNDDIESLDIRPGGVLRVMNGATLLKTRFTTTGSMSIAGVLDLAGGSFLSRAGGPSVTSFQTQIARGYNGGAWNGTHASGAINSSLAASSSLPDAVGYGLGSEIAINTIGGFSIGAGDVLIRYTRYGDADLNGVVNFDDYSRTDNGFINNRSGWVNGDFDFNNVVNFDDYSLIDNAFLSQAGSSVFRS